MFVVSQAEPRQMKRELLSPRWTTNRKDIPKAIIKEYEASVSMGI
ncbi:DUF4113 domain-containing protein [Scandinavium hiltneri]